MREFFKGWRRKVGVITLVMACVITALWVNTLMVFNLLRFASDEPLPYLFISVPLTLISAYLLLAKPRSSIQNKS